MTRITPVLIAVLAVGALPAASYAAGWAVAVFPSGEEFSLEVVIDPMDRARGYMYREEVGPNEGMLFIFEERDRHSIWMKNCLVALDIVWLDESFRVVDVAPDLQPCDPDRRCPSALPLKPARYVLEVAAGNAKRHGLQPGARVNILSELPEH
jgi:uncharacterized membrane protein (UPF0127 family)